MRPQDLSEFQVIGQFYIGVECGETRKTARAVEVLFTRRGYTPLHNNPLPSWPTLDAVRPPSQQFALSHRARGPTPCPLSCNLSRPLHLPLANDLCAAAIVPSAGAAFEIKHVPIPAPAHGEVVVKTSACGLCHSDAYCRMGHYPGVTVRFSSPMSWAINDRALVPSRTRTRSNRPHSRYWCRCRCTQDRTAPKKRTRSALRHSVGSACRCWLAWPHLQQLRRLPQQQHEGHLREAAGDGLPHRRWLR